MAKDTIHNIIVKLYRSVLVLIHIGKTFKDGLKTKNENAKSMNIIINPNLPMLRPLIQFYHHTNYNQQ